MMVADHAQEPKSHGINELLPLQRTWSAPLHKEREKGKEGEMVKEGREGERKRKIGASLKKILSMKLP